MRHMVQFQLPTIETNRILISVSTMRAAIYLAERGALQTGHLCPLGWRANLLILPHSSSIVCPQGNLTLIRVIQSPHGSQQRLIQVCLQSKTFSHCKLQRISKWSKGWHLKEHLIYYKWKINVGQTKIIKDWNSNRYLPCVHRQAPHHMVLYILPPLLQ